MSNVVIRMEEFAQYRADNILGFEKVKDKVIEVYNLIWKEGGEAFYEKESRYFQRIIGESKNLQKCTAFSVFTCIIDLAVSNLSVEPGTMPLAYLIPQSVKVGQDQNRKDVYEARCTLRISGYGELALRTSSGQIRYADNPIVVYEGDEFSVSDTEGVKKVSYRCNLPHTGKQVIGCFIRIVRPDSSVDYSWLLEEDIELLKSYSQKANKKWDSQQGKYVEGQANALYSSQNGRIDTGFLMAKTIKHAFRTYPKPRIGKSTVLKSDAARPEEPDYYGVDNQPEPQKPENPEPQAFGPEVNNVAQGVTIPPQSDGNEIF